jgi:nucleoside-diphosphate-sugar epimerase
VYITYANIENAQELLDYKPATNIKSGLKKFIEWFKTEQQEHRQA